VTIRRQKNIADIGHALERALDVREVLISKLILCELRIRKLRKRSTRAQKAYVKGDCSVAAGVAPSPFTAGRGEIKAELNDDIPI